MPTPTNSMVEPWFRRIGLKPRFTSAVVVAGIAVMATVGLLNYGGTGSTGGTSRTVLTTPVVVNTPSPTSTVNCSNSEQEIAQTLEAEGFGSGDFNTSEASFNDSLPGAKIGGFGAFSSTPVLSTEDVTNFLGSKSDPNASLDATWILNRNPGVTLAQVLDPANWHGYQLNVSSSWPTNTEVLNGHFTTVGEVVRQPGAIGWMFNSPSSCTEHGGKVQLGQETTLISGCSNPAPKPPCPTRQSTPTPTSTSTSTPTPTPTSTPTCPQRQIPSLKQRPNPACFQTHLSAVLNGIAKGHGRSRPHALHNHRRWRPRPLAICRPI